MPISSRNIITISALLLAAITPALRGEYVKMQARSDSEGNPAFSQTIRLGEGDACQALHFRATHPNNSVFVFCADVDGGCLPMSYTPDQIEELKPVFVGPGSVYVVSRDQAYAFGAASVKIEMVADAEGYLPQNSVVIPTDPSGQFEIILESSTDLVTWIAASPGTYASDTERRFFRVRAIRKPQ